MKKPFTELVEQAGAPLAAMQGLLDAVIEETITICAIPAPSHHERQRAQYVRARMEALGLSDAHVDAEDNAVGTLPGDEGKPTILVSAHSDTVFGPEVELKVERRRERLIGPGIGDNSLAVATMLALARVFAGVPAEARGTIIFAANSGEEGLGNLKGIRALTDQYGESVDAMLILEGSAQDKIVDAGVGSERLRVTYRGRGGHSWAAFGTPSAIHALGRAVADISRLKVPKTPKTTYNVGIVEGGISVNTIAAEAVMLVDMRSEGAAELEHLSAHVKGIIHKHAEGGIDVDLAVVGLRPVGRLADGHGLRGLAGEVRRHLGMPLVFAASSTDANVPLSRGIPALCIGIAIGGKVHTIEEFIDIPTIEIGLRQSVMMLLGMAGGWM